MLVVGVPQAVLHVLLPEVTGVTPGDEWLPTLVLGLLDTCNGGSSCKVNSPVLLAVEMGVMFGSFARSVSISEKYEIVFRPLPDFLLLSFAPLYIRNMDFHLFSHWIAVTCEPSLVMCCAISCQTLKCECLHIKVINHMFKS